MGAGAVPYLISRYFPMESFSEIYGYSFIAYAIAALLMGRSFDRFDSYRIAALALAGPTMASAITIGILPVYKRPEAMVSPQSN